MHKNILRRRLGVLENLYSGNLYTFYYSLSKCMAEVTLGNSHVSHKIFKKTAW